jgi:DNA-directed RNA polymerase subunit RPC12/RpoP
MEDAQGSKRRTRLRATFLIAYIAIIAAAAVLLLPTYWYLWLIITLIGLIRTASWYVPRTTYLCSKCGKEFSARRGSLLRPIAADLYSDTAKIKCPKCGSTSRTQVSRRGSK